MCVAMARGPIRPTVKKPKKGQIRLKGISGIAVRPTTEDIKIAEGLAEGKKKIEALTEAGISESNARSNSSELCSRPGVLTALNEALNKAHVGVDRIAQKINEGLEATRPVVIKTAMKTVPDFAVRHQYVRTASELLDLFPDKKFELPEGAGSLSVTIKRATK